MAPPRVAIWLLLSLGTLSMCLAQRKKAPRWIARPSEPAPVTHGKRDTGLVGRAASSPPAVAKIPVTDFRCSDHPFPGYFADVETDCQVYHNCLPDGRNSSFLCVNGTIFNQRNFVCDWWYKFDCRKAPNFFHLNLVRSGDTEEEEGRSANRTTTMPPDTKRGREKESRVRTTPRPFRKSPKVTKPVQTHQDVILLTGVVGTTRQKPKTSQAYRQNSESYWTQHVETPTQTFTKSGVNRPPVHFQRQFYIQTNGHSHNQAPRFDHLDEDRHQQRGEWNHNNRERHHNNEERHRHNEGVHSRSEEEDRREHKHEVMTEFDRIENGNGKHNWTDGHSHVRGEEQSGVSATNVTKGGNGTTVLTSGQSQGEREDFLVKSAPTGTANATGNETIFTGDIHLNSTIFENENGTINLTEISRDSGAEIEPRFSAETTTLPTTTKSWEGRKENYPRIEDKKRLFYRFQPSGPFGASSSLSFFGRTRGSLMEDPKKLPKLVSVRLSKLEKMEPEWALKPVLLSVRLNQHGEDIEGKEPAGPPPGLCFCPCH